jgi:hypothetical protein
MVGSVAVIGREHKVSSGRHEQSWDCSPTGALNSKLEGLRGLWWEHGIENII